MLNIGSQSDPPALLTPKEAMASFGRSGPSALVHNSLEGAAPRGLPGALKFNLSSREVKHALGSPRLFQRIVRAGWLKPLFPSRDSLYPVSRVLAVQQRLESGEFPPLLPCEVRQRRKGQPPGQAAA